MQAGRWVRGVDRPQAGYGWLALLAVVCFYMGSPAMSGTGDPDFWWHLMYADWMQRFGAIPTTDFISWSFDGQPYLLTQWLGQYLIGGAHRLGGTTGTSLLTLTCVVVMVLALWRACRPILGDGNLAMALVLATTTVFWSTYARPQMFSFVAFACLIWVTEATTKISSRGRLVAIAALMAAWVNLHGSYVVGLVYLGLLLAGHGASAALTGKSLTQAVRAPLQMLLAGFGATLVNPNGWKAWQYVIDIAGLQTTTSGLIMEWAPTSFGTGPGSSYILLLIAVALALGLSRNKPSVGDLVVFVGMGLFGLLAGRQTFYATVALVPLLARAANGSKLVDLFRAQGGRLCLALPWAALVVLAALGTGQALNTVRQKGVENWQERVFPVGAVEFVKREGMQGRLFNEVTAGGYVAYQTGLKVVIDGRLDLYGDEHFFRWFYARMGAPGWKEYLDAMRPDLFILQRQSAISQLLVAGGQHAVVYADERYLVMVPRTVNWEHLIARTEVKALPEWRIFNGKGQVQVSPFGY